MPIVRGNIYSMVSGPLAVDGQVSVQLCGYGSQVPRINGVGLFTDLETHLANIDPVTGEFIADLFGNDSITPAGTYYVFTFANANGDVVQVNAYRFMDMGNYDLNLIDPYDPNQPAPALPPLILNLLLIVPYTSAPDFPGDTYTSWQITLNGDATATFSNLVDGNLYTIIVVQDGSGDHNFNWPLNAYNPTLVNQEPRAMTVQTFVAVSNMLYPIGAGTYWP